MSEEIYKWDASEYLDNPEVIEGYLKESFEAGDLEQIQLALANVAKVKGMTEISKQTGLGRQNLYKALNGESSPKYDTINKVIQAMGLKLTVTAAWCISEI